MIIRIFLSPTGLGTTLAMWKSSFNPKMVIAKNVSSFKMSKKKVLTYLKQY